MIIRKSSKLILATLLSLTVTGVLLPVAGVQAQQRWNRDYYESPQRLNMLTGTYRLDTLRSDDVWQQARRPTLGSPAHQQERTRQIITRRLSPPEVLALDRHFRTITVASSLASQVTFEADGRDRLEQTPRGHTVRINAMMSGDRLVVSSTGDRGNDFTVTFQPLYNGSALRVTRRLDIESLNQPVLATSIYRKTSSLPTLNIPLQSVDYRYSGPSLAPSYSRNAFFVPADTEIIATLNNSLTSLRTRPGDRFTMQIQSPTRFDGAVIEGTVAAVVRPGRLAGRANMTLNFDRISFPNGRSYDFDGYIESVTTPNGEDIRLDREGTIKEDTSQGERTAKRSGIGAALGAVIGAVAGGGKGAAIGALLGAGVGAGSVLVQDRDDLELYSGTRFVIRAVNPQPEP